METIFGQRNEHNSTADYLFAVQKIMLIRKPTMLLMKLAV